MANKVSYKSYQSHANNRIGKDFEDLILAGCEYYRRKGLAEINRIPEHFRVTKTLRNGSFSGVFTGLAQQDFAGTMKGGKSIAFEAKATQSDRIKFSVLSKEQMDKLALHHSLGAITGVCCRVKNTCAFVPWQKWSNMKQLYGRLYMTEDEVRAYSVLTPGFVKFLDYVDGGSIYED